MTAQAPAITNLDLALDLAGRGWAVFPCHEKPWQYTDKETGELIKRKEKEPYTKKGYKNATTDTKQIKAWWNRNPAAVVGVACSPSGIIAVDIDTKNDVDGMASWANLVKTKGGAQAVCVGPMQATPSGGQHLIFKLPEDVKIPNDAGILGPGLDLRSDGYICTGSLANGKSYIWLPDHGPESILTEAPGWLLDLIRNMGRKAAQAPTQTQPDTAPSHPQPTMGDAGEYWLTKALGKGKIGTGDQTGFWLACQLRDAKLSEGEITRYCKVYAEKVEQNSSDPFTDKDAERWVNSALEGTTRNPATRQGGPAFSGNGHHPQTANLEAQPPDNFTGDDLSATPAPADDNNPMVITTWADMVNLIGPITWAWEKWLPQGVLTILAGEPGSGKSALALRLAASFLRGDPWPDGTPFTGETGAIIWAEAEAGQAINLQRAKAWDLPLDKLYTAALDPLEDFSLTNKAQLDALKRRAELPEVRLIIVDSLSGADSKAEKSSEDAGSVKWLAEIARDLGKPVILTHHLRKRGMFDGESVDLERLRGSSAIVQTARLVWALDTPDPQAKARKRLQVVKSNLAEYPEPLGLSVNAAGVTFGLAPAQPRTESVTDRAIDLLRALLQDEPRPAEEIEKEFDGAGISIATMKRAKAHLGIVSRKEKNGWTWAMPEPIDYDN